MPAHYLNDSEVRVIQQMIDDWKRKRGNTEGRPDVDWVEHQAPEGYIALTPQDGIPGLQETTPGYADCQLYQLVNWSLEYVGLNQTVFNCADVTVPGDIWVVIVRDKYGYWWVTGLIGEEEFTPLPELNTDTGTGSLGTGTGEVGTGDTGTGTFGTGTGTGTGGTGGGDGNTSGRSCALAGLRTTDCLVAVSGSQQVKLTYQGGRWNSIPTDYTPGTGSGTTTPGSYLLDYLGSSGPVEFWYESGRLHLSVGGIEMLDCGNACFSGGELTGHVEPADEFGTEVVESCAGETFSVCVECTSCDEGVTPGTAGTGGPPFGTGTGVVSTACCPSRLLPNDLYMTVESDCTSIALSTHKMTWDSGSSRWSTGSVDETTGNSNQYWLRCDGGVWKLSSPTSLCIDTGTERSAVSEVCDPLEVVFEFEIYSSDSGNGCTGCVVGHAVTFTITE